MSRYATNSFLDLNLRQSVTNVYPENKLYKLYIRSIPSNFDENSLRNLFLYFGNPLEIYRHSGEGPKWAFVSYGTRREAELAIQELNNRAPYYLKVQFAFSPEEKERIREGRSRDEALKSILESESYPPDFARFPPLYGGRGRGIHFPDSVFTPIHRPGKFEDVVFQDTNEPRDMDYYPYYQRDYHNDRHCEKPGIFMQRMKLPQTAIPRQEHGFLLAPKRDYIIREYTEEKKQKIREKLEALCATVTGDFLESIDNLIKPSLAGNCILCEKLTTLFCQRCRGSYCSRECQLADWPNHKSNCIPMLVPTVTSASDVNNGPSHNYRNETAQQYGEHSEKNKTFKPKFSSRNSYTVGENSGSSYRSNQRKVCDGKMKSEFERSKNYSAFNSTKSSVNDRLKIRQSVSDTNRTAPEFNPGLPTRSSSPKDDVGFDIITKLEVSNKKQVSDSCNLEETAVLETDKLSEDMYKKVKITVLSGSLQCWVQLEDSKSKLLEVMAALNDGSKGSPVKDLKQGMMCAALYEGLWYRGKVTSMEPELKVLYIDFGNEERCTLDRLRILPAAVESIPALAVKIKLAEGTSRKLSEDEILSIKCMDLCGDTTLVCVEGEEYSANREFSKKHLVLERSKENGEVDDLQDSANPAILGLKVGMKGGCQFQHELNSNDFGVTIVYPEIKEKFTKLFAALFSMKKTSHSDDYKPNVGETVAVFIEAENCKTYMRARVLAVDDIGYRVNLCDHGYVTRAEIIQKLPEDLKSIPEFGSRCTFMKNVRPKNENWCNDETSFKFLVTEVDEFLGTVTCDLKCEDGEVGIVILKRWIPAENDFNTFTLHNGDKVVLSVFCGLNSLYVRPQGKLSKIEQELNRRCKLADDVTRTPKKDEIVASRFLDDGKYYRARVLEANDDSIKLIYIDFGNTESVDKSRLKILPAELEEIPGLAVKVNLKYVEEKLILSNVASFYTSLIAKETEMEILISDSLKNGIELVLPDGKNLSDEVNTLLYSESDGKLSEEDIYTDNDVKYMELPVGKTVQFFILHKIDNTSVMGCEANEIVMSQILVSMPDNIGKYCESMDEKSYEPKLRELCLAKFDDGCWYRGICIDNTSTHKDNILFLDFGNTGCVHKTNIRKITEEFVKLPVIAALCLLKGFENITETQKKQVEKLVELNKIYEARIISSDGIGRYTIEFPHVVNAFNVKCL